MPNPSESVRQPENVPSSEKRPPSESGARLCLMLPRFSHYGGVEQFGFRLAGALAARGHAVDFLCARQETPAPAGVKVIPLGRPAGPRALKMLWFLIRAEQARRAGRYDLSLSLGKTWNQDIARPGGGPIQVFQRLSEQAWPKGLPRLCKQFSRLLQPANALTRLIEARMFRRTPHIVAISDTVRGWLLEQYPHLAADPCQTLHTIYNCPDISRFYPPSPEQRAEARRRFGVASDEIALGVACTNFALKGVEPLIRALPLLPEPLRERAAVHVAGGRRAERYVRLAGSLGLAERVRFHGKVADMPGFYHALDMFVLPTFYDTLGNVVLEALGSGLKTLCSGRAGASAFLPPEHIIRNPGDAAEIAAKIARLHGADQPARFAPKGSGIEEIVELVETILKERAAA